MLYRFFLAAMVVTFTFVVIGCGKSSTGNDSPAAATNVVGIYKISNYSMYDSITVNLRNDNRHVTTYYVSSSSLVSADSGAYTVSGSTISCTTKTGPIAYTLAGNKLTGILLEVYTKQ